MNKNLDRYLQTLIPERNALLTEMEEYADTTNVPIMERTGMEAMLHILKIQKPRNILEIGTAIGYSAIRMADTVPNASILTVERDQERIEDARRFIQKAEMEDRILIIEGDALESEDLIMQQAPFDCIFIDAAKGQYKRFFELYEGMLEPGGIIFSDNVLFKGLVAEPEDTIESKRTRNLVHKIKEYNTWLSERENFDTVILPIGDGLAVSIKKG